MLKNNYAKMYRVVRVTHKATGIVEQFDNSLLSPDEQHPSHLSLLNRAYNVLSERFGGIEKNDCRFTTTVERR